MAISIGSNLEGAKWFDYGEIDGRMVELEIRSSNYEPFLAEMDRMGQEFNQQFTTKPQAEHKPWVYFQMKACAILIKSWKRVDFDVVQDDGTVKTVTDIECNDENKFKLLYLTDGFIFWHFVKTKADETAAQQNEKRRNIVGK